MKKTLLNSVLAALLIGVSPNLSAQNSYLYAGETYTNNLAVIDTTGETYTVVETRTLTSTDGDVTSCHGLALDPLDGDMYILYELDYDETDRRLGLLDTLSGEVTDIGVTGNLTDISFANNTLYGTTGSYYSGYYFVEVNKDDATVSDLFSHASSEYGQAIGYDYFNNQMLKIDNEAYSVIDVATLTEELISTTGHPGECHAIAMKNDSVAIVLSYSEIYELNVNTNSFTYISDFDESMHSLAFGNYAFAVIVDGPTSFCANDPSTLSVNREGEEYQWYLDGEIIDGVTAATHDPTESGVYTCVLDEEETQGVSIIVIPAPNVTFTATPNPVYLGEDPTGSVSFENTTEVGDEFSWDFDNDFSSIAENPTFPFTTAGNYDVTLTVTDSETGCEGSATETISVIDNVGLGEIALNPFSIYPIPANSIVSVNFNENTDTFNAELMDINGKTVASTNMNAQNNSLDISELESGTYILKISNGQNTYTFQVIKN